ncbi:Type 1 glutamine amidotransferase-like domain-containing protein [Lacrimispora sp. JR3]|uniref:Type 1 glutamine amidotransferase-like domain-containing protein n=1 Tax=Lacrimispora sinapis TaxID=3111456 RepID=UPI0037485BEA
MIKLFLSSSFQDAANLLPDFISGDLAGKTVTFIPTAALHEKVDFFVESGKKALKQLGLHVEELEISTAAQTEIRSKLENNDFIYVTGGNTFFLLQEMKRTGADQIIKEQIRSGKPYIGESAGSIILSPNIEYVKEMDDCSIAADLENFDGLQIIDFFPLPHYNCFPFKDAVEKIISLYKGSMDLKPITNSEVILVHDGDVQIS